MIDTEVIDAKLRALSHRLSRVASKRPASVRALAGNEDLQDIVARNLSLAIQACIDIAYHLCAAQGVVPETSGAAFAELARRGLIPGSLAHRMQRAVGFRNVLVHEYTKVDWKIVMRVAGTGTRDLAAFGKAVVAILERSA